MLVLLLAAWFAVRVVWWENPFTGPARAHGPMLQPLAAPEITPGIAAAMTPFARYVPVADTPSGWVAPAIAYGSGQGAGGGLWRAPSPQRLARARVPTPDPVTIWLPGVTPYPTLPPGNRLAGGGSGSGSDEEAPRGPQAPPFLPPALAVAAPPGRWSLDNWAFWRQGSDAAPVSQGRVPVYGASQAGTVLQFRIAPSSGHDPRLYLRAYRALVTQGESELALGASARPVASIPLRMAGEVRYTETLFGTAIRPAGYIVSELPPVSLPLGTQLETYGQAGWVGGAASTWFADGQASVTGPIHLVDRLSRNALSLSLGAAVWGGAQKDAQRVDVGPTLRLDMKIGKVPTRVSVDWRQRVAGDASPGSGVAATVSTQF